MSETYDDGYITVCDTFNANEAGGMPLEFLKPIFTACFQEKTIGITRLYLAKGADEKIDMLVRIPDEGTRPRIGQYAVLNLYDLQEGEKGDQFRITAVQPQKNKDGLPVYDLQLERLNKNYDLYRFDE